MAILLENEEQIESFVNEYLKSKKKINPSSIFRDVAISGSNIALVGSQYDFTVSQAILLVATLNSAPYFPYMEQVERFKQNNGSYKYVHESKIHDALKVLSLAVYGVRLNRDLIPKDYKNCAKAYQILKETFLSQYNERLKKLRDSSPEGKAC